MPHKTASFYRNIGLVTFIPPLLNIFDEFLVRPLSDFTQPKISYLIQWNSTYCFLEPRPYLCDLPCESEYKEQRERERD